MPATSPPPAPHAGDFAYDLDTLFSGVGNDFMNGIQPYAATHPMLGSPGNHEARSVAGRDWVEGGGGGAETARLLGLGRATCVLQGCCALARAPLGGI